MQKRLHTQLPKLLLLLALLFGINSFGQAVLDENFSSASTGNSTSTGGSSNRWNGNTNFPTVVNGYEAGGSVRLGSGSGIGSITSRSLDLSSGGGNFTISFSVKGWTNVEGSIKVTAAGTPQTASYTATLASSFQTITLNFTGGTATSTVKIETTAGRAFIDNVVVQTAGPAGPSVTTNAATSIAATNATLNGSINANGTGATAASFDYGTSTSYGSTATATPASVTGSSTITADLTGLTPNTTYYFRAVGTQSTATNGGQQSFLTLAATPGAPIVNGATTTSLNVTIVANGNPSSTEYAIQVGSQYVQPNGLLSTTAFWQTATTWGTKTIRDLASSTQYTIGVKARNTALAETGFATSTGTTLADTAASITTGGTIATLSTTYGTPSATTSFTVTSANLTADVTVTAPAGFEVSLSNTTGFTSSVTVPQNTANNIVYIRLAATATATTYTNSAISISSNGTAASPARTISGNITRKALTISGLTAGTKVYDATRTAPVTGVAILSGVVNGDAVTLGGTPSFNFADANVGNGKAITITGFELAGAGASNYTLTLPALTGSITARAVTIENAAAQNKPYDTTQDAIVSGTVNGRIASDDVTVATTGQFAQASVGDNIIVNGFTLTGVQAANYILTQQPDVRANITKGVNTLSAAAINLGSNATYALPGATVSTNSNGVLTYSLTTSPAVTLNQATGTLTTSATLTGTATLTITQAETANYLGKTVDVTVNVTALNYVNGDYMTKTAGTWNNRTTPGTATWYKRVNGQWIDSATEPSGTADTYTVYITKNVEIPTATTQLATARIYVTENATLTFNSSALWTFRNIYIGNGAAMQMNTRFTVLSSGAFEIADGGNFIYNYPSNEGANSLVTSTLWNGVENFHPNSNFVIRNHDTGSGKYFLPVADTNITANTYNGVAAYFGNLIVDSQDEVRLTTTNFNGKTLTHKNLEFAPNSAYVLIFGNLTWTIGGNLVVSQPLGSTTARNVTITSGTNTIVLNVKGDIINNSKNTLRTSSNGGAVTINVDGNITLSDEGKLDINPTGTSIVNVKGDVSATANAVLFAGATAALNFNGIGNGLTDVSTQTIDIATTATTENQNVNFNIKSGAYVKLLNRDFELGTSSKLTVENGGIFDFGFAGFTPLVIKTSGAATGTSFVTAANSTLKVTSENGLNTNGATTGNVQVATATYNVNTDYYYQGIGAQAFGNGFSSARNINIEKPIATDVVSTTQNISTIAQLNINKGVLDAGVNVLGGTATNFTLLANGKYRTSGAGTKPSAAGTYTIDPIATVEFYGADATNIRTAPNYGIVLVSGTNVGLESATEGLKFNAGGSFEVTNESTFKVANATGFNGGTATAITTTGNPAITLGATSNVVYNGTAGQTITEVNTTDGTGIEGYGNLTVTAPGVSQLGASLIYARNNFTLNGENASLVIETGKTLKVGNQVTENGGTIDIENNGALLQVNDVDNTGTINVKKNSNSLYRLDYTMWSSPVSGVQTLSQFSPRTLTDRFYEYGIINGAEHYINIANTSELFTAAKGYLIRMPDTAPPATVDNAAYRAGTTPLTYTGTFTGTPNNGDVTITASTQLKRFTAVGNPYPSPISVTEFFSANSNVIDQGSAIYFWRKRNGANTSAYATLTLAGQTAGYRANANDVSANQGGFYAGAPSTWLISQGQGFIVKTSATAATGANITFNNSMRRPAPATGDQAFFRTAQSSTSRLWLNLVSTTEDFTQMAIAYVDGATTGLDYGYDGKMFGDSNTISLYTIAEDTKLAIQARPVFNASDIVPVGYKSAAAGQFTIELDHTDGVFTQGQNIYLKDNVLNIYHDLSEGDYSFATEAGTFNDRFEVVYTTEALGTTTPQLNANSVIIYKKDNTLSVNAGTAVINSVTVFDIRGRKLASVTGVNATTTVVAGLEVANEILIIEVNTAQGRISKKIVY